MEGLENKLDGVHVGDILMLHSPHLEVNGYVVYFDVKKVKLSHENPFSKFAGWRAADKSYRNFHFKSGDRTYNLRLFESRLPWEDTLNLGFGSPDS